MLTFPMDLIRCEQVKWRFSVNWRKANVVQCFFQLLLNQDWQGLRSARPRRKVSSREASTSVPLSRPNRCDEPSYRLPG